MALITCSYWRNEGTTVPGEGATQEVSKTFLERIKEEAGH
jgi:hypothetical protein